MDATERANQRNFEDRSGPSTVYRSQARQKIMKRRAEKRESELEQERARDLRRQRSRERFRELDRRRIEEDAVSKEKPWRYSRPSTRSGAWKKVRGLSAIEEAEYPASTEQEETTAEEEAYRAFAEQQGVTVEQVKQWVEKGYIDVPSSE